jgi:hypothetical protein
MEDTHSMSEFLERYLELRARLARVRWIHAGAESSEEDELLETMDAVWWSLTEADHQDLRRRPAAPQLVRPLVRSGPGWRARVDADVLSRSDLPPRTLSEVA